jgi:hypothetical protein
MSIISSFSRNLYAPLCRIYARHSMPNDEPADRQLCFLFAVQFYLVHHYWPTFTKPRSFSEKICSRMLFDRNPLLTLVSDKLSVRDYVAQKAGSQYLIPLIWQGNNPNVIPFNKLPIHYAIKTNHGCGYNILVKDKSHASQTEIILTISRWLKENYCTDKGYGLEWAYKNISPSILIETFLDDNGSMPLDYKFYCYAGRVEIILMVFGRYHNLTTKHFTRNLEPIDLSKGRTQHGGHVNPPINFELMLEVAERLATGFDFIRVDLYNLNGRIYFGELTCYPATGLSRFKPRKYDYIFGEKWDCTL